MNAPFSPRAATAVREPFTAYVCDDSTADMLRSVVGEFGWQQDKINKGGLRNAVQSLSVSASPLVLFVDLSESGDPLNDINALAEVCEPGTVVIAAGQVNDVRLYRDLLASGIQDYLLKPFNPDQMRDAFAAAQLALAGPRVVEQSADQPHLSTAIVGVRGGVGASALASSIAWLFAEKMNRSTALLDLDVHFGTGALSLDLEPGRGLTDAIDNPSRIDGLFIERAMVKATDQLSVLSAEAPINQPLLTDGSAFFQLQEEIRNAFQTTVIDLPRSMLVQHPHLMHDVQTAVIVTELTLAGTRDTIRLLSWMKANASHAKVLLVANKVLPASGGEVSRKDFEGSVERKIDVLIPHDAKLAVQAAKLGKPMAEVGKTGKVTPLMQQIVNELIATVDTDAAERAGSKTSKSLLGKLGDLKTMLPAKKKG
jgi:pilus assembly protein CpaE